MRNTKIICTIGRIAEKDLKLTIHDFVEAGMDIARLNMAHYDVSQNTDGEYLKELIKAIREEARNANRAIAILGDIQGPKVRIKDFLGIDKHKDEIELKKGDCFMLTSLESIPENEHGASIKCEGPHGRLDFFSNIRATAQKDDKTKPIEFWFGDGRVILQASVKDITDTLAICQVRVAGKLAKGKGVSVKNAKILPGIYNPEDYEKDQKDIEFLIAQEIDLIALSFVNSAEDVENLRSFIRYTMGMKLRKPWLQDFPIISKIETEEGRMNLDNIMSCSYGILVARGDLALRTGIAKVGIYQKEIIEKCVDKGKPVITATQMLLSMMEFIEPRRSEVADVTNAIQDGSDALMLSEETADSDSEYPVQSIQMMASIIVETESRRSKNRIEYKHDIDRLHDKAISDLENKIHELERRHKDNNITDDDYESKREELQKIENIEHISYDACKTAFELKCRAIVVLTDTGGTARMISRFGPDAPILTGVYNERMARLLRLSYGVEPYVIACDDQCQGYPFAEFRQVIHQAKRAGVLKEGDRVIEVAGYPPRKPGTTTFLNIYEVNEDLSNGRV